MLILVLDRRAPYLVSCNKPLQMSATEVDDLEKRLKEIVKQLKAVQTRINKRKNEPEGTPLSALEEFRKDLIRRQVEIMVSLDKASAIQSSNVPSSLGHSTPPLSWEQEQGSLPLLVPKRLNQTTLVGFIKIMKDGKIRDIDGPKVVSDGTQLVCKPCGKSFKSREGLIEHQNHCLVFKEQRLALSTVSAVKRIKRQESSATLNTDDSGNCDNCDSARCW